MRLVLPVVRPYALAMALAVGSAVVAVAVAASYDLPLRDPDGIAGPAYVRLPLIVALFVLADVLPRVVSRRGGVREVLRERYGPQRLALVAVGLASFYLTYVSYRNLKGGLPFARDELHDDELLALDRTMAFGNDPAELLHGLLGTGVAAHVLSVVYLSYLAFVPLSLGAALVWGRSIRVGAWYVTALCLNWLLGAASYYLLPTLGPVFVQPGVFAELPETGVALLQASLAEARASVLADPQGSGSIAGIAGFASLHTSVVFTAAWVAHLLGMVRAVRWSLWAFFALTVLATAYFGWHYLVDDLAGVVIAVVAVSLGWAATRPDRDDPQLVQGPA